MCAWAMDAPFLVLFTLEYLNRYVYTSKSTLDKSRRKLYVWRTIASFLIILFAMPLGHALMLLMEHYLAPSTVHVAGFLLGFAGLIIVIVGVFVRGDTRQTLLGLLGGLLFWTGWVEFLFLYYAHRYGVHPELVNGVVSTTSTFVDGVSTTVMHINGQLVNSMSEPWVKMRWLLALNT